jgi:hypothetical protein
MWDFALGYACDLCYERGHGVRFYSAQKLETSITTAIRGVLSDFGVHLCLLSTYVADATACTEKRAEAIQPPVSVVRTAPSWPVSYADGVDRGFRAPTPPGTQASEPEAEVSEC